MNGFIALVFGLLLAACPAAPTRLQHRILQRELAMEAAPSVPAAAAVADHLANDLNTTDIAAEVAEQPETELISTPAAAVTAAVHPAGTYTCYHYTPRELQIILAGGSEHEVCWGHGWFSQSGTADGCGTCWCCGVTGTAFVTRKYSACYRYDAPYPLSACKATGTMPCLARAKDMTVEKCARAAALAGYPMLGVQGRRCVGIPNSVIFSPIPEPFSACSTSCPGEKAVKCGYESSTSGKISLYHTMNSEAFTGSPPSMQRLTEPYVGCFREPVEGDVRNRLMTFLAEDSGLTLDMCFRLAREAGFKYAAVQSNNQCFGSNDVKQYIDQAPFLAVPTCDRECFGNRLQTCGGAWANSIYYVGGEPAAPPDPSDRCSESTCPTAAACQAGGGCNPADGSCNRIENMPNGVPCAGGGYCIDGRCERDACNGVSCPPPPTCKTGGQCNPITGSCDPFKNGPNGAPCEDGGSCFDGVCEQRVGIQDITFVTGSSSLCPVGYDRLPTNLNKNMAPTYVTKSIYMCVKRTSDSSKMLHSLRVVNSPGVLGTWCNLNYETKLPQNLNAGSTGAAELDQVYVCVEYPSSTPTESVPARLVLDVAIAEKDVSACPPGFNFNFDVDLNGIAWRTMSPCPLFMCVKMLW